MKSLKNYDVKIPEWKSCWNGKYGNRWRERIKSSSKKLECFHFSIFCRTQHDYATIPLTFFMTWVSSKNAKFGLACKTLKFFHFFVSWWKFLELFWMVFPQSEWQSFTVIWKSYKYFFIYKTIHFKKDIYVYINAIFLPLLQF